MKVLKEDSVTQSKLNELFKQMDEIDVKIHASPIGGIIYEVLGSYFKHLYEGEISEVAPPFFDGRFIKCDINGNTDSI